MSLLIDTNERNFSLSSMLPYDLNKKEKGEISKGLVEYTLLLQAVSEAIEALENGEFEKFDALVGENMCQVRAIKTALIASSTLKNTKMLKQRLAQVIEQIAKLSKSVLKAPRGTLGDLFAKEGLEVLLSSDEAFLTRSYLLTLVKETKPPKETTPFLINDSTDSKKLTRIRAVSNSFASNLVAKLRSDLSKASVEFVRSCAETLPKKESLMPTVAKELIAEHNGCQSLPFFFVNNILLKQAKAAHIPIVIQLEQVAKEHNKKVNELSLLFIPTSKGYQRIKFPTEDTIKKPAFVLHGVMQRPLDQLPDQAKTIEELSDCGIIDLILINSASHRQSLDPSKSETIEKLNNTKFTSYKSAAIEKGCTLENPSLFFINHAFCGAIGQSNQTELSGESHEN